MGNFTRLVLLALTLLSTGAFAQQTTGGISGRVLDATGSGIPGAEVTATQSQTGDTRKVKAGSDGSYSLLNLPIGPYQLSATHTGFKKTVEKGLELHVSEHIGYDLTLQVGDVTQEVSVTADADQLHTESAEQTSLISGEQVRELQLNGRSFFTLLELIPGVTPNLSDRVDPNSTP